MTARLLDGKALAQTMQAEIAADAKAFTKAGGPTPGLDVVLVGDNHASRVYVRNKRLSSDRAGFAGRVHELPASVSQAELLALLDRLNADPAVHGILVQLPLPRHIDEAAVIHRIDPHKDVDTFHPENVGLLASGHPRFLPCTPHGVVQLLIRNGITTAGKRVVIIGRSNIVGKPLALILMQKPFPQLPGGGDATVTVAHSRTPNLPDLTRQADILVAAVGQPGLVTADMVKPGATVIDVGMNRRADGKLAGDVDFEAVAEVAGAITPVPGGVGPMTITMLLHNTLQAARRRAGV
jgi:methylenetetrahydrofolate dehydrogenase (NADP+)/methenyltetrahydrofolate cyclohydrolase